VGRPGNRGRHALYVRQQRQVLGSKLVQKRKVRPGLKPGDSQRAF